MGTSGLSAGTWRTSSRSIPQQDCVEVAVVPERVGVRDSKHRSGPTLVFAPLEWQAFLQDVQRCGFDHG